MTIESTTLGEAVARTGGSLQTGPFGSQLHASDYTSLGTPLIMPVNLSDNEIREEGIARIGEYDVRRLRRHVLREDDIVFSRRGDVGRRSIVRAEQSGWICGTGCLAARFGRKLDQVNPAYVALYIGSSPAQTWLSDNAVGGTMPNLNTGILSALPLHLPSRAVQDSIVTAMERAQATAATLKRLIAKKQAIKQGMMQQLLTGKTRLPGFIESWKESALGSVARVVGGGTPSTQVKLFWGGQIPWFTPAEIDSKGSGLVSISERTITPEGLANSGAHLLPAGSVLVTSRATLGNCAVAGVPVTTNQGFASLIPNSPKSTWFLYYWVQQYKPELESRAAGSTFLEISARKVAAIPLNEPSLNEQEAIGVVLQDTDAEITALRGRLDKARAVKQGMMQELLTGRTRLPIKEVVL